jgi:hypothetical protein
MPGWSTHCDANHLSPMMEWNKILNDIYFVGKQKENIALNYK